MKAILLALAAMIHLVWGRGELADIVEDLWIAIDKELILSIPMFSGRTLRCCSMRAAIRSFSRKRRNMPPKTRTRRRGKTCLLPFCF